MRITEESDRLGYGGERGQGKKLVSGFMFLGNVKFQDGYNGGIYGMSKVGERVGRLVCVKEVRKRKI